MGEVVNKVSHRRWKYMFIALILLIICIFFLLYTFCTCTPVPQMSISARLLWFVLQIMDQMLLGNYTEENHFFCREMILWVIQTFRGCTRPEPPLGDPKMPMKQRTFTGWIGKILEWALFWPVRNIQLDNKTLPTPHPPISHCCHLFFPLALCEQGLVLM